MEIIEKIYGVKSIVTEMNYFRFEFQGDERVQDKGMMKREALLFAAIKLWKDFGMKRQLSLTDFANLLTKLTLNKIYSISFTK